MCVCLCDLKAHVGSIRVLASPCTVGSAASHGRLPSHLPSWHPLLWTSRRAEGSPGPLGRPILEGPALHLDLLLSLTRAPRKQLWQVAPCAAWRTGRCPGFSRSGRTLARAGITPVAETAINFHSLSSCTDSVDEAAGGAFFLGSTGRMVCVRKARSTHGF